ncbi:MAG: hypothetical protein J6C64_05140 [Lachnospiraceae bacterium]|nr:hypothetical protein [Lachnospiraceae bacterium]
MGNKDDSDNLKYLEENYCEGNAFIGLSEWWKDLKQAKELDKAENYLEIYMEYLKDKRTEHHYLVDGAILTCTRCTLDVQKLNDKEFTAPEGSNETILKVTKNTKYLNGAEQYFATIKDCGKFENIEPFGNCLNPPDREEERKAIILASESVELRKLGTCRYLMKLNDEWENLISDTGYQEVTGFDGVTLEEITMESILFCRHGGFIYPVNPGYIMSECIDDKNLNNEEMQFALQYGLSEKQSMALLDIRKYFEEKPELLQGTTIFAFEGLGTYLEEGEVSTWNGKNSYHPNGQFGAILIVTKNGQLAYAEARASTLPDNMEKSATVLEGYYTIKAAKHKSTDPNGYAAVQLKEFNTNNAVLPAYNSVHNNGTVVGVNLHMAGKIKSDKPVYSEGCITVTVDRYRDFGVAVGFIKDLESNKNAGRDGIYANGKAQLHYEENIVNGFEGYMVIDRKYYDAKERELLISPDAE